MPTGILDLETGYSAQDYLDVDAKDDVRVAQTGTSQYIIHQFKDFTGSSSSANLEWEGQASQAPSVSTVYLQIFNRNTPAWETVDTDNATAANTDFVLSKSIADLTNYKDASGLIVCRVYQLAT